MTATCLAEFATGLQAWTEEAIRELYAALPCVEVICTRIDTGSTALRTAAAPLAAILTGSRNQDGPVVRHLPIGPKEVALSWERSGWDVRNRTPSPLRVVLKKDSSRAFYRVNPGESYQVEGEALEFDLQGYRFELRKSKGAGNVNQELSWAALDRCPNDEGIYQELRLLDCDLGLRFARNTSPEECALAARVLHGVWTRLAAKLGLDTGAWLGLQNAETPAVASSRHYVRVGGSPAGVVDLAVPEEFCGKCCFPARIRGQVQWQRHFMAGHQSLLLSQLHQLGPETAVRLCPHSAALVDWDLNQTWNLTLSSPPPGWGEVTYRIGNPAPARVRMGGSMTNAGGPIDIGNLEVSMQVIVRTDTISVSDLEKYAPGQLLKASIEPDQTVSIAINGNIVGQGKLVTLEGALGVRVVAWYV